MSDYIQTNDRDGDDSCPTGPGGGPTGTVGSPGGGPDVMGATSPGGDISPPAGSSTNNEPRHPAER